MLKVQKRNGDIVRFDPQKIEEAIWKAVQSVGGTDRGPVKKLTDQAVEIIKEQHNGTLPTVETIQDIVEKVLVENRHAKVAKSYILYRERRNQDRKGAEEVIREEKPLLVDARSLLKSYLYQNAATSADGNANMSFSLQGFNNFCVEAVMKELWDAEFGETAKRLHKDGSIHVHDKGLLAPYCMGHDLEKLLRVGFRGAPGKIESRPAKHFDAALGQIVNFLYTLQGEAAGAQAFSSFDTYLAPFVRHDSLSYQEVKKMIEKFIFNMNIPTRVGFQTPFTNISLDMNPHPKLKDRPVIIGGTDQDTTYGDYQREMDMINTALFEVMSEGDGTGRMFSFPIPTVNITKEFDWNAPVSLKMMQLATKFGSLYFANFVNADQSPEDVRSMCCRLRLDNTELEKRGGGLFGSNPLTGSINVVTLNMGRIGYLSENKQDFKARVAELMEAAKDVCEKKRKVLEDYTQMGLYPYTKYYLGEIKDATGEYYKNHFSTIGLNGMNEACLNLLGKDLTTKEGVSFTVEVMEFMREMTRLYQEETGNLYNLEASPAEGATYRFARMDQKMYPGCALQGEMEPYYTNSTQLPVGATDDIFDAIQLQEPLQTLYTGGTVLHGFLGESPESPEMAALIIKRAFQHSRVPYLTLTPTFSICPTHGYMAGEAETCQRCGAETEIWSRVVGFHRPVKQWNLGKQQEYQDRVEFVNGTTKERKEGKLAG